MPPEKNKESTVDEGYRICEFLKEKGAINKTIYITIVAQEEDVRKRLCKLGIKKKFILPKPPDGEKIKKLAKELLRKDTGELSKSHRTRRN